MKIEAQYSHLNGLEFLLVHKPQLWDEIRDTIASVNAGKCRTKVSKEKRTAGQTFYSPIEMNACMACDLPSISGARVGLAIGLQTTPNSFERR